jgi:hypothetical protein
LRRTLETPIHHPLDLSVRVGCECVYTAPAETPILVLFKPRQGPTQLIREERIHFEPGLIPSEFEDEHGNIVYRMALRPGQNLLRYDAIVKVPSVREDVLRVDGVVPPQDYEALKLAGAEAIFPPGTVIAEAAEKLLKTLNKRLGHHPAAG